MEIPLLQNIVILLALSVGVIYLFQKLHLPTILGFLVTGVVFGPSAFGLIEATHEIEILSEIGIILLLFIIGLEFSLTDLARIKKVVFLGGGSQVLLTIAIVFAIMVAAGMEYNQAAFFGFLVSLSSTAIVLNLLQSRGMMNSPNGKIALGILIFQDVIVVPMMLLTPMLAGEGGNLWLEVGILILKVAAVIALTLFSARMLVPRLLRSIVNTRSRELFIIAIVVICFAVAWGTSSLGLSLSLGAFLAGLIISESEYSHQATGLIIPFREIFTSFFFVSIGMLLDLGFVIDNLLIVVLLTVAVFLLKFVILYISSAILKYPPRTSIINGFSLFQVGEFAFILAAVGMSHNLLEPGPYQYFLAVSILTMAATPFVFNASDYLAAKLVRSTGLSGSSGSMDDQDVDDIAVNLDDHLLIIGFGLNGRNMADIARKAGIPYAIIDINTENVEYGKSRKEPIIFGDGSNPYLLEHLHVYKARVVMVAVSDPSATKKILSSIRSISNSVHILVRIRFLSESDAYLKLGANEVISEELETSMEIFTRVLHQYLVPEEDITSYAEAIRQENYKMLRPYFNQSETLGLPGWHNFKMASMRVETHDSSIVGIPLSDAQLRKRFGVSVMAIYRREKVQPTVDPSTHLETGDLIYVFGHPDDIRAFGEKMKTI